MKISLISLASPVWWKINRQSPLILDVQLGNYSVVNPILIGSVSDQTVNPHLKNRFILPSENEIVFSNSKIGLIKSDESIEDLSPDKLFTLVSDFLIWARFLGFQIEIPSIPRVQSVIPSIDIPEVIPTVELYSSDPRGMVRNYIIDNAITEEIAKKSALRASNRESIPVFHQFVLDAYASYTIGDYRQCILNSAIAAESYLGTQMDSEYRRRLSGHNGPELRLITIPQAGGTSIKKDPIYESLASKTDFSSLLHERPLYLLGRSIMVDEPETYKLARMLYATRNRIAHRGELSEQDMMSCFSMTTDDAQKALKCVKKIFQWFGDDIVYPSNDSPVFTRVDVEWQVPF